MTRDPYAPVVAYKCTRCLRLIVTHPMLDEEPNPVCPFCGHAVTVYQPLKGPRR